jgi:hypothetical protein
LFDPDGVGKVVPVVVVLDRSVCAILPPKC